VPKVPSRSRYSALAAALVFTDVVKLVGAMTACKHHSHLIPEAALPWPAARLGSECVQGCPLRSVC
jgi:hypothetical protein